MEWIEKKYCINGYEVHAQYSSENVKDIFMPLIEHLESLQKKQQKRILVFLAAPPASGKSTLVAFLKQLSEDMGYHNIQSIGMDGFHYPNEYLDFHFIRGGLLREVKGCPESFDLTKLTHYIKEVKNKDIDFPVYDRNIHNPKEQAKHIDQDIILLEGNYLLLKEDGWRELKQYCEYAIFIQASEDMLEKRLIDRKAKSTTTIEEAIEFYQKSDKKNIHRVLNNTMDADLKLLLNEDGSYTQIA